MKMTRGGRNLFLLGFGAIVLSIVTTAISLVIYHESGDIYLDRSRPGYLPDEKETEEDGEKTKYTFSESGSIDKKTLDEYLDNLQEEVNYIDRLNSPFSDSSLSDEALGISQDKPSEP